MKIYATKIEIDINKEYLLYNDNKVNEELSCEELENSEDKIMNMMNIIINEINNSSIIEDNIETKMNKENENFIIGNKYFFSI